MHPATPPRVRAVGFDFDHTLGIDNKLERVTFLRLLGRILAEGGHTNGTLAQEGAHVDEVLEAQRSGAFSIDEAVERFVRERGVSTAAEFVALYKRLAVESVPAFVVPMPGIVRMLAALRERDVPVAILTNGWTALQEAKAAAVGFDGPVLASEQIGVQKPRFEAFDLLARRLRTAREDVWFIGDTPRSDVAGALQAGMRAVWFDAEGLAYPRELPSPTKVIHSLDELVPAIEGHTVRT